MTGPRARVAALAATLSVGALVSCPQMALADVLAPDSPASSSAGAGRTMYVIMAVLTVLFVVGLIAAILRAVRAGSRGGAEPERQTRGSRGVQRRVAAGLGAVAIVLFVVAIVFTQKTRSVEASQAGAEPISIQVTGQQWVWRYEYPEASATSDGYSSATPYSYYDLYVPVDTPITLNISSTDVLHRWWVPALTRAADAVPRDTNTITFTPDRVGTYYGRSTEFSGPGYSTMRTAVHVVEPDEYKAFLAQRTKDIAASRAYVQKQVDAGTAPGVALER